MAKLKIKRFTQMDSNNNSKYLRHQMSPQKLYFISRRDKGINWDLNLDIRPNRKNDTLTQIYHQNGCYLYIGHICLMPRLIKFHKGNPSGNEALRTLDLKKWWVEYRRRTEYFHYVIFACRTFLGARPSSKKWSKPWHTHIHFYCSSFNYC